MKKIIFVSLVLLAVVCGSVQAKDVVLDTTISDIVTKIDKNGNEYVRMMIPVQKELSGVKYEIQLAVMAFGDTVKEVAAFKVGDKLKAIASLNSYRGRDNYNIIKVIQ